MYSLGHQVGNAVTAWFCKSDGYIYTPNTSLLPPFKRRTCFLQASRLRCISPPWCVVSWVIKFLRGEIRQPPEGFMSVALCRLSISFFFVVVVNWAGGVGSLWGREFSFCYFWVLPLVSLKSGFWMDGLTGVTWHRAVLGTGSSGGKRAVEWSSGARVRTCCLWGPRVKEHGVRL